MKYKFIIKEDTEEDVKTSEKEGMSFKKIYDRKNLRRDS